MKTVISKATNRGYMQVQPGAMPKLFERAWGAQVRDRLRHELAGFGFVKDLNLDENGTVHLDLGRCSAEQRQSMIDTLLVELQKLGLHHRNAGVEYCELLPGQEQD